MRSPAVQYFPLSSQLQLSLIAPKDVAFQVTAKMSPFARRIYCVLDLTIDPRDLYKSITMRLIILHAHESDKLILLLVTKLSALLL